MKLVSLYVENFGGLSQYALQFNEGITVIQQPNGFGKTTLAEFIRAMFYGFPRKTRTLEKSLRQKYAPWNGGVYGGNLVFDLEGERYRIERTFGATPRGDSFDLIDLGTNKKSTRFSEEIGLELFRLDSDSFERSTYMPQLHDGSSLTTDNIQAKLANLVEDPGDMGNFDKAMTALRARRSGFIPYRGSGGTVAEAHGRISALQEELDRTQLQSITLADVGKTIAELEEKLAENQAQQEAVHSRLLQCSESAAVAAVHREHSRLVREGETLQQQLAQLLSRYPKGIPSAEQIARAQRTAGRAAVLEAREVTAREDLEAAAYVQQNSSRFAGHIPEPEELEQYRQLASRYFALRTEAQSAGLSDGEKEKYKKLLTLYQRGELEEDRLEMLDKGIRELTRRRHELESAVFEEADQQNLLQLQRYFSRGVPEERELAQCREELGQLQQLQQENVRLAAALAAKPEQKKSGFVLPVLAAVLAAAAIAGGIYLLLSSVQLYAAVCLGAGGLLLCGAVLGFIRASRRPAVPEERTAMEANEERAASLEQRVRAYVVRYSENPSLPDGLHEISSNREDLMELTERQEAVEKKRQQLQEREKRLDTALRGHLGDGNYEQRLLTLRLARNQFLNLQEEAKTAQEKTEQLEAECEMLHGRISGFLGIYYEAVDPEKFHSLLSDLQRESGEYLRCRSAVDAWQRRKAEHEQETLECRSELAAFFEGFGLSFPADVRAQLLQIRDDRRACEELTAQIESNRRTYEAFAEENREKLAVEVQEFQEKTEQLRQMALTLREQGNDMTGQLLRQKQLRQQLQTQLERIPELRDELERWQEVKTGDQKKAQILDDTMDFLCRARESLQNSYLGPVRSSFARNMQRLMGEKAEQILLTPDLQVQLERSGKARELGYFSAGQTDTVMLCMRLALVDALFAGEKPFVILDDPFVNLDDARTAQALALLKDLSEDLQIVYLVCNSSRNYS